VTAKGGEAASSSPGSLIVTFAGLYLREAANWIAVADLVALLGIAGQAETAVRQALVRLKSRQFLQSQTRHGRAGYALTDTGLNDLLIGDARIFRFGEAPESSGWVLAVFSVPEQARSERHRLRSHLSWMGFGTVSAGVWIAPATLAAAAQSLIESDGLAGYVTWFTGHSIGAAEVSAWWDLGALRLLYDEFLQRWQPVARPVVHTPKNGASAFADYLQLVDSWRQFPRIDPGLPAALLPANWQGRTAFDTFTQLRSRWATTGHSFVMERLQPQKWPNGLALAAVSATTQ